MSEQVRSHAWRARGRLASSPCRPLVDKACGSRYPDGCSSNAKRIIQRNAATLDMPGREVFYKARKDSDGKKVF